MERREFIQLMMAAGTALSASACRSNAARPDAAGLYEAGPFGQVRLLHMTDCHAQLQPVYFREPHVNIGLGDSAGRPPHLVGKGLLQYAGLPASGRLAHAFTYLDFVESAKSYGKVGGFAHLATLVKQLREEYGSGNSLLLDGGDTWQGSGTAYWSGGKDMVEACNLLGVDVMTGHWEFTYQDHQVLDNIKAFNGDFIAHNVRLTDEAVFMGAEAFDEDTGHVFRPYTMKELAGHRVAVIGQAFPYTPIANPSRFIPDWTFGIRAAELQQLVDEVRTNERPAAVILLSHNGMDVDLKLASVVTGIDAILGGHTHDGMPRAVEVANSSGKTIVTNAGSNGKFLGVLDLDIDVSGVRDYRYRLLPVFSRLLSPDPEMQALINGVRAPYLDKLQEPLAVAGQLLFRRGNFNGSFDQVICDAQRAVGDAQIAFSPGFRWGTSVLPGDTITMEQVLDQTCITYPETYVREMKGEQIKLILEDVADNLFNPDPFYQQGGDMVRVGGMDYVIDPMAGAGQRISAMTLDSGELVEANKTYKVAGWATVNSQAPGPPIWDVVATYLRDRGTVRLERLNTPRIEGIRSNPGMSDWSG